MNKKLYIALAVILVIILSQLLMIKMIYSHQLKGDLAIIMAKFYNLKAGSMTKDSEKLEITLADYMINERFARKILAINFDQDLNLQGLFALQSDEKIDDLVWDNMLKQTWLKYMAAKYDILVSEEEMQLAMQDLDNANFLAEAEANNLGISNADYKNLVIRPFLLEAKVYEWLLENYNDLEGIQNAQLAYESLEAGRDFAAVAEDYSDDMTYVENSFWLKESDLQDFYEPIGRLNPGEFSKIVTVPGAYIIWYLENKTIDDAESSYEVKGIFMLAKSIDQFFDDYLSVAKVDKKY